MNKRENKHIHFTRTAYRSQPLSLPLWCMRSKDQSMVALIEAKSTELIQLCQHYGVQRLELFGSATRDDFDPASSDLDFLVLFQDLEPIAYADAYFGLLAAVQALFERRVELIVLSAVKNPYFLQKINSDRQLLYAA